ncbi:MAG: DUF6460 domain-containing protein [Salaquimonas sp.]|jgi:hypothetical protein|nr:DUF6460 domain-containing protein [Salaquimonas sp.]
MSEPFQPGNAGYGRLTRFLGDTPGRTIVKLAVLSLIVGIIMSALNFTPIELWYALRDFFRWLYDLGYEAFARIGIYFVWGAMVVVPIFLLMRILNLGRR